MVVAEAEAANSRIGTTAVAAVAADQLLFEVEHKSAGAPHQKVHLREQIAVHRAPPLTL